MLNSTRPDPYSRIKKKIYLPLIICSLVVIASIWLTPSLWTLPLVAVILLSWAWMLVCVWKYQPSPEESTTVIRNFQMVCTLGTGIWLFFGIPVAPFMLPFLPPIPPPIVWICFSLAILAIFCFGFFIWQSHRLIRSEQTITASKNAEKATQESL
jgi:cobalamin synthase